MEIPPIPPKCELLRLERGVPEFFDGTCWQSIETYWNRRIPAAVAEVEWRKEAERLMAVHDTCECSKCCEEILCAWDRHVKFVQPAIDSAAAWRAWREAEW